MDFPHSFPESLFDLARKMPYFVRDIADFNMDYEIGSGGYGVVYHAMDKKTNSEVAVKQLRSEKLGDKFETKYVQEIYTNAICNNRFIVKFIGFTLEEPYAIITEFQPKGTLNKIIYGTAAKNSPPSWTQLTIIALGLSNGLAHLASLDILHRDIKASNVLLNGKNVPTITDFGLARFESKSSMMTKRNGTPMYMAPELFGKENYTKSVDVFAFGMMLYEMAELHVAYKHYTKEEIQKLALDRTEYPEFTENTPPALRKLIERCWGPPENRPTMQEIYDSFANLTVSFRNPEKKKLKKLVDNIQKIENERKSKAKELPPCYVDVEKAIEKILNERKAQIPQAVYSSDAINWDIISHYNHPSFVQHFKKVIGKFQEIDLENVFKLTYQVFGSVVEELIIQTLDIYRLMMLVHHKFIEICFNGHLLSSLPSASQAQMKASLEIIAILFAFQPQLVDQTMEKIILYYIKVFPQEMIIICSHYIKQISDARAVTVLDSLLRGADVYFGIEAGVQYLTLFYNVLQENDVYSSQRAQFIRSTIVAFTKSTCAPNAATAYRILSHIHPQNDVVFASVLDQLSNPTILSPLLSVLLRVQEFPNSRRLCSKLIEVSKTNAKGFDVLLLYAQHAPNSKTVAMDSSWYTSGLPALSDTFRLLLLLYTNQEAKNSLRTNSQYPSALKFLVQNCDIYILTCFPPLIRRSVPDYNLISELDKNGFLDLYFQRASESNDTTAMYNSITLVETIATIGFVNSLIPEIGRLKSFMSNNSLISSVIAVLPTLSQLRECRPHLQDMKDYFISLLNYNDYKTLAQTFLANINM